MILTRATGPEPLEPGTFLIRRAVTEDALAHARDIGTYPPEAFEAKLASGRACYLAIDGGRVLHSSWCATGPTWTEEIQAHLAPPPGDAYVYESFTQADARGRGIYPAVLRWIAGDLHEHGLGRVWIGVDADNRASIRAIEKAGFVEAYSFTISSRGSGLALEVDHPVDPTASLHVVAAPVDDP